MTVKSPEHQRAVELAGRAFIAAMGNDTAGAVAAMKALSDECGPPGITLAIKAFCDTALGEKPAGLPDDAIIMPAWREEESGQVTTSAAGLRPEVAWAGQLLVARARMDQDGYEAILAAIPRGLPGGSSRYVGTLLQMCAATVRARRDGGSAWLTSRPGDDP